MRRRIFAGFWAFCLLVVAHGKELCRPCPRCGEYVLRRIYAFGRVQGSGKPGG